jgi:GT2 family glycosyltransferase
MSGTGGNGSGPIGGAEGEAVPPTVSVVVCTYSEERWEQVLAAIDSVARQTVTPLQRILIVDHNEAVRERAAETLVGWEVHANLGARGLAGGRNTGVEVAKGEVVAFLDDDATADERWLEHLLVPYGDPSTIGTGGAVLPSWPDERPSWFPPEFDWVVGCSYVGLPAGTHAVRNPIGANMSFRRSVILGAGGFDADVGRLRAIPLGCEETLLSIRALRNSAGGTILYVPDARVTHTVGEERVRPSYFFRRCVAEGLSKALVAGRVGSGDALKSEWTYVTRVLTRGVFEGVLPTGTGVQAGRSLAIVAGFIATCAGYVAGRLGVYNLAARWVGARTADRPGPGAGG